MMGPEIGMMHHNSQPSSVLMNEIAGMILLNLLQAVFTFEYCHEEIPTILGQLSIKWSQIVSHLRLADRIKAFKYHMKEVNSICFRFLQVSSLL